MKFMPDAFNHNARRWPDRLALEANDRVLTFGELDRMSARLASRLRGAGAGAEVVVGVLAPRTSVLVIAMLAVWRAGAAFMLLDPAEPRQRARYMLGAAGVRVVVGSGRELADWADCPAARVVAEDLDGQKPARLPAVTGDQLAYVVFTSGSTGQPKGVLIEHGSLAEHAESQLGPLYRQVPAAAARPLRVGGGAPVTFDSFIDQFLPMVMDGHTFVLLDEASRLNPQKYMAGLDVVDCTPAHLELLVDQGLLDKPRYPQLIVFGGEKPSQRLWNTLRASDVPAVSVYGATECTISSMEAKPRAYSQVTLGHAAGSAKVYLLDEQMRQVVKSGQVGEIYLGGPGVARGYAGNPSGTAGTFLPDPFSTYPSARMYRTGDLGELSPNGRLDFRGRFDSQLKIRGFRIEPGEIEAALEEFPGVRRAAVTAAFVNGAPSHLVAHVECCWPDAVPKREDLRARLPEHMLPSVIIAVQQLPLTRNGKIDRALLLDVSCGQWGMAVQDPANGQEPANGLERRVLEVWRETLGSDAIGVTDDFISFGGHSLAALTIVNRLLADFDATLPLDHMLSARTVREMADLLAEAQGIHTAPPQ